jgi:hypothetical protein
VYSEGVAAGEGQFAGEGVRYNEVAEQKEAAMTVPARINLDIA